MAITVEPAVPGFEFGLGRATLKYIILGTEDPDNARDALIAAAPALANSAVNADYDVTERVLGVWDGTVEYAIPPDEQPPPPGQEDDKTYTSFTTIGGTAHITQSISTVGAYCEPCQKSRPSQYRWDGTAYTLAGGIPGSFPPDDGCTEIAPTYVAGSSFIAPATGDLKVGVLTPGPTPPKPPMFGGAIGVTKDSIEGTDIVVPEFKFQGKAYLDDSIVDDAFVSMLNANTGRVNNAVWKMFQAGEVLFLGATGSREGRGNWEITFEFAASPNVTGLSVGSITGIKKRGWEYLWVRYQEQEDEVAHILVRKPMAVYIEQVYHYTSFGFLTPIFG